MRTHVEIPVIAGVRLVISTALALTVNTKYS
jgi:hypothetical protein